MCIYDSDDSISVWAIKCQIHVQLQGLLSKKNPSNYEVTEGKVNNGQAVAVEVKYSHTERGINKCYIFN